MEDIDEILERALRLGDEGDLEGMAEELRGALADHPNDPYVLCWLGVAERELGLEGIAYERFKRCLAQDPEDPRILATAGNAIAAFDDPDAEAALRTASVIAPELPLARYLYGAYLSREGQTEGALRELDAARELAPDDPVVAVERGIALALAGRLAESVDELGRAVELEAEDGWAGVLLGLALVEVGRVEEGTRELVRAAALRPEDVEAQMLAALAASSQSWEDTALEMLERARYRAEGAEARAVLEVEEHVDRGPEAALDFLKSTLAPVAFRERLMVRP